MMNVLVLTPYLFGTYIVHALYVVDLIEGIIDKRARSNERLI